MADNDNHIKLETEGESGDKKQQSIPLDSRFKTQQETATQSLGDPVGETDGGLRGRENETESGTAIELS